MPHRNREALAATLAICGVLASGEACAQAWPSKAVRVIVPFGAGGGTDIQGRLLAKKMSESTGQTFVIDNRPGAAGMIGAELVAKSPADGHTVLFTTASIAVNTTLYRKSTIDPVRDLAPVSWVSSVPLVLVVHPSVPAKTVQELIALAKRRDVKLSAASNGSGTTSHLAIEMLRQLAGVHVMHIPFKGGGPAVKSMLAGEADLTFATVIAALPHIRSGALRPLAVTTAKRSGILPELPTMASFYPGFETDNWYAIFLPAATPKDIVARLNAEVLKALKAPEVRELITKDGGEPVGSSPEELAKYFRREVEKYAKVIKAGNITAE